MVRKKLLRLIPVFIVLLLMVIFGIGLHNKHLNFVNSLKKDQYKLIEYYKSYSYIYFDIVPKNINDVQNMLEWTRLTSDASALKLDFLQYGYDVVYDSIERSSIIYSFGRDKINNELKIINRDIVLDSLGQIKIENKAFFVFLSDYFKEEDIPILKIYESDFPCDLVIENLDKNPNQNFQLFKKEKNLWNDSQFRLTFLTLLGDFERKYSSLPSKNPPVFVKYKKGNVDVICDNDFNQSQIDFLEESISTFFKTHNEKIFFDYALFSVSMISKDDTPNQ